MRPAFLILTMMLSTTWIADAAAQPVEVASGADLVAWQALEHRRLQGDAAVLAYRTFVETYTSSQLAVMAYGRLVDLKADEAWMDDLGMRGRIESLRRSWLAIEQAKPVATAVAFIDLSEPNDDATVQVDTAQ